MQQITVEFLLDPLQGSSLQVEILSPNEQDHITDLSFSIWGRVMCQLDIFTQNSEYVKEIVQCTIVHIIGCVLKYTSSE